MQLSIRFALVLALVASASACMVGEDEDAVAGDSGEGEPEDGALAARVCADAVTTLGIDVSHHQGTINWPAVKAGGVQFAFVRVSDGTTTKDRKFTQNWAGAKSAGVIRGIYQFFRPSQNVAAQAKLMIDALATRQPGDLPPVIDVEVDGGLAPATVASRVRQWVDAVAAATGEKPIVYTGKYFWRDEVGAPAGFTAHPLWIANYTPKCPDIAPGWSDWTFWQNSATGRVAGITGNVDLNKFNGSVAALQAFATR